MADTSLKVLLIRQFCFKVQAKHNDVFDLALMMIKLPLYITSVFLNYF